MTAAFPEELVERGEEHLLSHYKFSLFLMALVKAKEGSSVRSLYSPVTDRHGRALQANVISQLGGSTISLRLPIIL